ncbi:MAG: hypothetical protein R2715_02850 [Ilumatobacteraceae bacterium]
MDANWKPTEVLAYSTHDGPGRPPRSTSPWIIGAIGGVLLVSFAGLVTSPSLCPEHRAWVQALAAVAIGLLVASLIGLWRGWASAPLLTVAASCAGISIGLIDAVHAATRGRIIALLFALAASASALIAWRSLRFGRWDRAAGVVPTAIELPPHDRPTAAPIAAAHRANIAVVAPDRAEAAEQEATSDDTEAPTGLRETATDR